MRILRDACASGHSQTKVKENIPPRPSAGASHSAQREMSRNRHTKRQATICSSASSADQTSRANATDKLSFLLQSRSLSRQKNTYVQSSASSVHKHRSSGAPSTDAVGDAMQSLPVVPFRELVVFGRRRDVCADHFDGEIGDFIVGYFGAVELEQKSQWIVTQEVDMEE